MDKLKMHSPDLIETNIARLADLFPNCVTEARDAKGELKQAIDFDLLRQELASSIVEGPQERYQLNWPGKREALLTANAPIAKTLRPCRDESVDFDTTQNLFIEGDNLDALKLLQETYLNKVKLIYIDPPYNTGNDFIYEDDFAEDAETYFGRSAQKDESGNRLIANTEANGRFHSDWISMIYPRLKLARNLLRDDGVIFISIGDEEIHNLRRAANEVFGEMNYRGTIARATGTRMGSGNTRISSEIDFIVIYAKSDLYEFQSLPMDDEDVAIYDQQDERGRYLTRSLRRTGGENRREDRPTMYYPIAAPDGQPIYPIAPEGWESRWVCGKEKYEELLRTGLIEWKNVQKEGVSRWQVYQKHYLGEGLKYSSNLWVGVEGNKKATRDLNQIFDGRKVFDHPKPVEVLQRILMIATSAEQECVIMDFFSGSGTTAHAVIKQNCDDKGKRQFIAVQLPEALSSDNKTQQVALEFCDALGKPRTIAEVCKERIRRAGKKIKQDNADKPDIAKLDIGFRVLKIDTSNMREVYYTPDAVTQEVLPGLVDNVRADRSAEDLLFQVLLDWGVDLALPISQQIIAGKTVFFVDGNALAACFETGIDEGFVKQLAAHKPLRVVFRDAGFVSDSVKINVEQVFKLLSPATEIKTL
ncbi:MAG: site-specific DNA-methyltransferase [Sulfuritalea sp.]|nr:site-specific DNA-methyltransferase [Sulfuritalea sp.]